MKKTKGKVRSSGLKVEYRLDYRKSRANRFAPRMRGNTRAVVLDPDLASVFRTSKAVNDFLRSVISALPGERRARSVRKKKAG